MISTNLKTVVLLGVLAGTLNYFAVVALHDWYAGFGTDCIPPGEPFITCGPAYLKLYYFVFRDSLSTDQLNLFLTYSKNVVLWSVAFLVLAWLRDELGKSKRN